MKREIEFRGKRKDNGQWVYGNYVYEQFSKKHYITQQLQNGHRLIEVIPETVGQYTRCKDNKGNKVYTGDIVKSGDEIGLVIFDEHYLGYFVNFEEQEPLYDVYIEKIGNKIDNPELLEKE